MWCRVSFLGVGFLGISNLSHKKIKKYIYIKGYCKMAKTRHQKPNPTPRKDNMKFDFNNEKLFLDFENKAIDGQLNYDDFPPCEYKFFSKLAKLGYMNRHNGWSVEICEEKQRELKDDYKRDKDEANMYLHLSQRIFDNVIVTSNYVRQMYKTNDKQEIVTLALKTIENLTNENGFADRITKRIQKI